MADSASGLSSVRFVLVQPRSSGNVGAAARAIKNCGFLRLDLVEPRCDPRDEEANRMAVGASDLLETARIHSGLDQALEGVCAVAGTTRRVGKHRQPHRPFDASAPELLAAAARGGLAVVFGREESGLTDQELDRCTHLVFLPTADAFGSLNLAQAVLLAAWELRRATGCVAELAEPAGTPATHLDREAMFEHLEGALLAIGFLSRDTREILMRRLRRLLGRAGLGSEDVRLLRGIARQTLWAAGRAGLTDPRATASSDDGG